MSSCGRLPTEMMLIFLCSQNILESTIVEKDSQIAELEVRGVLDEADTRLLHALRTQRDELLDRLKTQVTTAHVINSAGNRLK